MVQISTIQRNAQYTRNNVHIICRRQLVLSYVNREELRTTPEKIDTMMENKHVLSASKLLSSAIKQSMSKDMMQIGALDDIRRTLNKQKNVNQIEIYTQHDVNDHIRHFTTY